MSQISLKNIVKVIYTTSKGVDTTKTNKVLTCKLLS